jgi:hypothetical protein
VDSGPVIFGLSTSATGFAFAGARLNKDIAFLNALSFTSEVAGFSFQYKNRRRYLLSPLVGDAIMLGMKTATRWDDRFIEMSPK